MQLVRLDRELGRLFHSKTYTEPFMQAQHQGRHAMLPCFRMTQCQLTSVCVQVGGVGPIQLHIVAVHNEHGNLHLPILAGNKHLRSIITRFQIRTAGAFQQAPGFLGQPSHLPNPMLS